MNKFESEARNCTQRQLAEKLREMACRNVDQDRAILLEAANRIENVRIPFNHEQFE